MEYKETELIFPAEVQDLYDLAQIALQQAYAPYSNIKVAAAVRCGSGQIYTGVNIENSTYSLTICAERSCIFHGLNHGERDFIQMVVVTDSAQVTSPCGACRQVLLEFAPEMEIYFANPQKFQIFQVDQLLPSAFSLKGGEKSE